MLTDVIQVELVGKPWWDDPLPIAAIVISLASVVYTWWARRSDRASLDVKATSFMTSRGRQEWNVAVTATNNGLTGSAVVDGVHFKIARKKYLHMTSSIEATATLPATVAPDATLTYVVSSQDLAEKLVAEDRKPNNAVPVVTTGRKKYRGRWDKAGMDILTAEFNRAKAIADAAKPESARGWRKLLKR